MSTTDIFENLMGKEVHVITHTDNDGYACGAVIQHKYPNAIVHVTNHGFSIPRNKIPIGSIVILTDMSYSVNEMRMLDRDYQLVWIDHHERVLKEAEANDFMPIGIRSTDSAACVLTWKFFMKGMPVPRVLELIDDYDRWQFKLGDDTIAFNYGSGIMDLYPCKRNKETWDKLLADKDDLLEGMVSKGRVIHEFVTERDSLYCEDIAHGSELTIPNPENGTPKCYKLVVANLRGVNSNFFNTFPDRDMYHAAVIYAYVPRLKQYRCSIYAIDETVDVSYIAKQFGGNGHKGAAGWTSSTLPFAIPTQGDKPVPTGNPFMGLQDQIRQSNLIRNYLGKNSRIGINSLTQNIDFRGRKAVVCNTPFAWPDIWTFVEVRDAEIGIAYSLTNTGKCRVVITDLVATDMQKLRAELSSHYPDGCEIMEDGTLWYYAPPAEHPADVIVPPSLF